MPTTISGTNGIDKVADGSVDPATDIEYNQTLTDVRVTPGRTPGTTYNNGTSQPIAVMLSMSSTAANSSITGSIDGILVRGSEASVAGVPAAITVVVPAGKNYSFTMSSGTATVMTWVEIR